MTKKFPTKKLCFLLKQRGYGKMKAATIKKGKINYGN